VRRTTKKPEDIKAIIVGIIKKIEKQGPGKKEIISHAWEQAVGGKAITHSRPVEVKKGILVIEVDSSAWLYDLTVKKQFLLGELKKKLEAYNIKDIRFRIGDVN